VCDDHYRLARVLGRESPQAVFDAALNVIPAFRSGSKWSVGIGLDVEAAEPRLVLLPSQAVSLAQVPIETAVGQPGFPHELGDGEAVDAVAANTRRGDVEDAVMARCLRRLRRAHDLIDPPTALRLA